MTDLKRCVWAVAVAALAASGVFAQTGITGGTGFGGGTGGTGFGGGTGQQGGQGNAAANAGTAPTIGTSAAVSSTGASQSSNILSPYYANPLYAGAQQATGTTITGPGGFGQPTFGGTGTAAAGTGGRATSATSATGRAATGGLGATTGARTGTGLGGATTGLGGATTGLGTTGRQGGATTGLGTTGGLGGGLGTTGGTRGTGGGFGTTGGIGGTNSTAQALSTGRAIAYTQSLKFGVAPLTTPQLQTDVQTLISTSSTLSGVNGLQATVGDGGLVVLKGKVADEEEARLVEGMILLTPGVKGVKNELQFPPPPKP